MELSLFSTTLFFVALSGDVRTQTSHTAIIFTQVPAEHSTLVQKNLPSGTRIARIDPSYTTTQFTVLTSDFAAAGYADVSFDGRRILFVGRRAESDPTGVWEMNVDGSWARLITTGPGDCRTAIYLSTIYTIDADEPYYQIAFLAGAKAAEPGQLFSCRLDGSRIGQITFSPFGVSDPLLLSDGRLLCSVWLSRDRVSTITPTEISSTLMTLQVDGTELFPFAGQHEAPEFRSMACETPNDLIVYVESLAGTPHRGGQLVSVARTRSLRTRKQLTHDRAGLYLTPSALPNGQLLLSHKSTQVQNSTYGIYKLSPRAGAGVVSVFDAPDWHDIDPEVVLPRKEPEGRSSVIRRKRPTEGQQEQTTGHLYGLDAYLSDTEEGRAIRRGDIKNLRIFQLNTDSRDVYESKVPDDPSTNSTSMNVVWSESVLGEAPVEPDGSFFVEVPAQVPLRLETLGQNGSTLQRMKSWFWVMPGERRGCIGCHEDRELTPPNRHVEALRKKPHPIGVIATRQDEHPE